MKRTAILGAALTALATVTSAFALDNAEFSQQVTNYERQIKADPKMKGETVDFCQSLGKARRGEEPKCVALNKIAIDSVYGNLNSSRLRP